MNQIAIRIRVLFGCGVIALLGTPNLAIAQPDGNAILAGMGTSTEIVLGYYFYVSLDGLTLTEQEARAEDYSFYEDCNDFDDTSDADFCDTLGCSVTATAAWPYFVKVDFPEWSCGPLEDIPYLVQSVGANLPTSTNPSYIHAYTAWGDHNVWIPDEPPYIDCQARVRGNSLAELTQLYDVDDKKANFSIGWKLCARFYTAFWGPSELRWPWKGGGLGAICGSPQIGDYISYRRSIAGVRMTGMSPSLVLGIIRKNHHGGEYVPDGTHFLGAPDGAGPFEQTAFSYTYYAGQGEDFAEGWTGSYTGNIAFGSFVGPDLEITPVVV